MTGWTDLRCPSGQMHGRLVAGMLEVSCRRCRDRHPGSVRVTHRYVAASGDLVETVVVRDIDAARLAVLIPAEEVPS